MPSPRDLLVEIGTEELPPKDLLGLAQALERELVDRLRGAELAPTASRLFAAPRRLGVLVRAVAPRQPDRQSQRRGPAVAAAFDDEGNPTPAALGFARSCGVSVELLDTLNTDKGSWLAHNFEERGKDATELIPGLLTQALEALPIPKRMRWGKGDTQFVRPVHWVLLLYGDEVVECEILACKTGRLTYGHRFHHPQPLSISDPATYEALLETEGRVLPDFTVRREAIRGQVVEAALACQATARIDEALLEEVTALVEWPVAILGSFDEKFLAVPHEALVSTMQDNQKYFPVVGPEGRLLPRFITVSNIESADPDAVRKGNERVIRPRFADAEFFWNQDRKIPLADRLERLRTVTFERDLGTLHDKVLRMVSLAGFIAEALDLDPGHTRRAAELAKCDLLTQMVYEFPDLQGIMGRYYAGHDGEPAAVARALEEHYQPRFSGDELPTSDAGVACALADRIDTLVGIFAVGKSPSGAKDPYALRRAALAVMRILVERALPIDLEALLHQAVELLPDALREQADANTVFEFALDRLQAYYTDQGFRPDELDAVRACRPTEPLDFDRRLRAVAEFRKLEEAASLEAANKRIRNILRKADEDIPDRVDTAGLTLAAERVLSDQVAECVATVHPIMAAGNYREALLRLAPLRPAVDAFFDQVMVMDEDAKLRRNRLALLQQLEGLFLRVADFSRLQH
jgi:glycyl-tRNA synthetase beta chain